MLDPIKLGESDFLSILDYARAARPKNGKGLGPTDFAFYNRLENFARQYGAAQRTSKGNIPQIELVKDF